MTADSIPGSILWFFVCGKSIDNIRLFFILIRLITPWLQFQNIKSYFSRILTFDRLCLFSLFLRLRLMAVICMTGTLRASLREFNFFSEYEIHFWESKNFLECDNVSQGTSMCHACHLKKLRKDKKCNAFSVTKNYIGGSLSVTALPRGVSVKCTFWEIKCNVTS